MFSIDIFCLFPQCMLASIPLIIGVADAMARACIKYWVGAPLCFVVVNALSRAVSSLFPPAVGVETPRSISVLWCNLGRIGVCPLGEESLIILVRAVHLLVFSIVSLFAYCKGLQSALLLALPLTLPQFWVCWQLPLVSFRCCFHKATSGHSPKSRSRTAIVTYLNTFCNLWRQLRPWPAPIPCVHARKTTAARTQYISVTRAPTVHSNVLQTLNLQSWQWRYKSAVLTSTEGDLTSNFLSHMPTLLPPHPWWFQAPPLCMGNCLGTRQSIWTNPDRPESCGNMPPYEQTGYNVGLKPFFTYQFNNVTSFLRQLGLSVQPFLAMAPHMQSL